MVRGLSLLLLVVLLLGLVGLEATSSPPKIHVYSRHPVENGKTNVLNCYIEGFYPPNIEVSLLKNNEQMDGVQMSDLSFGDDWTFQRLLHVQFVPNGKDVYDCEVKHSALPAPKKIRWEPDN
ncbi:beta-2-microglobulin [Carettochelys insculpta]|uniref:beta-2-microglobulin n=1 Tax=Carettochelys insculpta TaxID=44489 RepID=UPI003EBA4F39